jgi:hypothetical protein
MSRPSLLVQRRDGEIRSPEDLIRLMKIGKSDSGAWTHINIQAIFHREVFQYHEPPSLLLRFIPSQAREKGTSDCSIPVQWGRLLMTRDQRGERRER